MRPLFRIVGLVVTTYVFLMAAASPPDFDRVTHAFFLDSAASTGSTFVADLSGAASTCSTFWATDNASTNGALKVSGNSHRFTGCLYSNSSVSLGSGSVYEKTIRYVTNLTNGTNTFLGSKVQVAALSPPYYYTLAAYAPGGCRAQAAAATGNYFIASTSQLPSNNQPLREGLWWYDGKSNINVNLQGFTGNITIVSPSGITITDGAEGARWYMDGILGFSNESGSNAITLNGGPGLVNGTLYAPHGQMFWKGQDNNFTGQVLAKTISVAGGGSTFRVEPPAPPPSCAGGILNAAAVAGPPLASVESEARVARDAAEPMVGLNSWRLVLPQT